MTQQSAPIGSYVHLVIETVDTYGGGSVRTFADRRRALEVVAQCEAENEGNPDYSVVLITQQVA